MGPRESSQAAASRVTLKPEGGPRGPVGAARPGGRVCLAQHGGEGHLGRVSRSEGQACGSGLVAAGPTSCEVGCSSAVWA